MQHGIHKMILLAWLACGCQAPYVAEARELFRIDDVAGDDHGSGEILYPDRGDLFPGDLDLLSLRATAGDGGTWFSARFKNKIRRPAGEVTEIGQEPLEQTARLGFYTLNLDLYIDQDRVPGSGSLQTLPGRKLTLNRDHAWEKCVALTPRPHAARTRLEQYLSQVLAEEARIMMGRLNRRQVEDVFASTVAQIDERYFFPTKVRARGREIRFFVPDTFLGGPASADWSYAVLVTGADVQQSAKMPHRGIEDFNLMLLPVAQGRRYDRFGLTRFADVDQPPVIDVLMPLPGAQARLLTDYDLYAGRLASVPGIVPSADPAELLGVIDAAAQPRAQAKVSQTPSRGMTASPPASSLPDARPPASQPAATTDPSSTATPPAGGSQTETPATALREELETGTGRRSLVDRLNALNLLREEGLISEEEYQELRRRILSEI